MIGESILGKEVRRMVLDAKNTKLYSNLYRNLSNDIYSFSQVPFLEAKHLWKINPSYFDGLDGALCVYFTSGTTSEPKAIYYTTKDIQYITDYLGWFCKIEGIAGGERVAVLMDQFFWGVGYFTTQGHVKAGNTVIPIDTDLPKSAIADLISVSQPTVISSLPSVLLELKDVINSSHLKVLETTGEILDKHTRKDLESHFGAEVFDAYGLTEGVIGVECFCHNGYHFLPKKVHLEIIDPETNKIIEDEKWGELVMSILSNSFLPIIRYRTGDICKISHRECSCGQAAPRVWIKGRRETTIYLYEGSNIALKDIEAILSSICGKFARYTINTQKSGSSVTLHINLEEKYINNEELIKSKIVNLNYETMYLFKRNRLNIIIHRL